MDLGTNGEIFLGNRQRMLTCSAAAGPALEGARISSGMIAKTGAIEGVRIEDDRLEYRVISNTRAKGLCGSGLVDLVAVLLHLGLIDHEGLMRPSGDDSLGGLDRRLICKDGIYDFLIGSRQESLNGRDIYLTQRDVRELQLAKAAVAAGVASLMDEMEAHFIEMDAELAYLEVRESNEIAQNAYKKRGYQYVRTSKGYYGDEDALIMMKSLTR